MNGNLDITTIFFSLASLILFTGIFYGQTKKKLKELEEEVKEKRIHDSVVIDKFARIETKIDFFITLKHINYVISSNKPNCELSSRKPISISAANR